MRRFAVSTHRFDVITKALAAKRSRRAALQTTGPGIVAGLLGVTSRKASAQDATSDLGTTADFLFVQTATSGAFSPNPAASTPAIEGTPVASGGDSYLLTLAGHHGGTIYVSDRPNRIFGEEPTGRFLDGFGFSPVNPPNAALVVQTPAGETDVVILKLLDPTYDETAGTVTYGATILAEYEDDGLAHMAARQQDDELPETFGRASLFIDACGDFTQCVAWDPGMDFLGPIPDGPYQACWSDQSGCYPCGSSTTYGDLVHRCNQTYATCNETGGCLPM
jgi:hypothetical protein